MKNIAIILFFFALCSTVKAQYHPWRVLHKGNSFGATMEIGTKDNYDFTFKRNNTNVWSFLSGGAAYGGSLDTSSPFYFALSDSSLRVNSIRVWAGRYGYARLSTAVGVGSLLSNTTGNYNAAFGYEAMTTNTTGGQNAAFGYSALRLNTTGTANMAIGFGALNFNTTGSSNTAVGSSALNKNTTGGNNTAIGISAFSTSKASSGNTMVGSSAGLNGTDTTTPFNGYNSALGINAMRMSATVANNIGVGNSGIGAFSLYSLSRGSYNTTAGYESMYSDTTGYGNAAFGAGALRNAVAPVHCTAIGDSSYTVTTNYTNSTAVGYNAQPTANNQVVLGDLNITQLKARNFAFNVDQTVGAGQDNYVLTYDNGTGEIGLEVTAEVDGSVTNEGVLSVGAAGANTSQIATNTSGDGGVILKGGTGVSLTESADTITINSAISTLSSTLAIGGALSMTTATPLNIDTLVLTAGTWLVSGNVNFSESTATTTEHVAGITTTSATIPTDGTQVYSNTQSVLLSGIDGITIPSKVVIVATGTTNVYLVGSTTFSAGTIVGFGSILAWKL